MEGASKAVSGIACDEGGISSAAQSRTQGGLPMNKHTSFDLFMKICLTVFAVLLIVVGIVGPISAFENHVPFMGIFPAVTGILGAWLLLDEIGAPGNAFGARLRGIFSSAR